MVITKQKWKERDYVTMLDGYNLNIDGSDICRRHHHFWFTRSCYLDGKPENLSVKEYFDKHAS